MWYPIASKKGFRGSQTSDHFELGVPSLQDLMDLGRCCKHDYKIIRAMRERTFELPSTYG